MKPVKKAKTKKTIKFCKKADHDWQYMELMKIWYCTKCSKLEFDKNPLTSNI